MNEDRLSSKNLVRALIEYQNDKDNIYIDNTNYKYILNLEKNKIYKSYDYKIKNNIDDIFESTLDR